jgi:hypothetical protein
VCVYVYVCVCVCLCVGVYFAGESIQWRGAGCVPAHPLNRHQVNPQTLTIHLLSC